MFFRRSLFLFLVLFFFPVKPVFAEKNVLVATPDHCVALRKGRECYATVTFEWQAGYSGDFCLVSGGITIQCWSSSRQGTHKYKFSGEEGRRFLLVDKNSGSELAETEIAVSWVYQTRRQKRRWRLF